MLIIYNTYIPLVMTLTLGSQPKARACKGVGWKEAWESHFMFPGVQENVKEWTHPLPSEFPNLQRAI
jgi:hypothetical protein